MSILYIYNKAVKNISNIKSSKLVSQWRNQSKIFEYFLVNMVNLKGKLLHTESKNKSLFETK